MNERAQGEYEATKKLLCHNSRPITFVIVLINSIIGVSWWNEWTWTHKRALVP